MFFAGRGERIRFDVEMDPRAGGKVQRLHNEVLVVQIRPRLAHGAIAVGGLLEPRNPGDSGRVGPASWVIV